MGSAVAAHQVEGGWKGGKGPSVVDVLHRRSPWNRPENYGWSKDDCYYPNHEAVDFYHHYKGMISDCLLKWVLSVFGHPLPGPEFFQMAMKSLPMRRD